VPVVDVVLVLPPQPRHLLHQYFRVPDLDLLHADPRLDVLPDQTRRHRVGVSTYLDRAALPYPHPSAFLRLQPTRRQWSQGRQLLRQRRRPPRVAPLHQLTQKSLVLRATREVPAPTQQQCLRHRFLKSPVALFAVPVLVAARRVRRFAPHSVVLEQSPIPHRELLRLAVRVHRQGHSIRAVSLGRPAQFPESILHPHAQVHEVLREAHQR